MTKAHARRRGDGDEKLVGIWAYLPESEAAWIKEEAERLSLSQSYVVRKLIATAKMHQTEVG
jgi:hypothetical protein